MSESKKVTKAVEEVEDQGFNFAPKVLEIKDLDNLSTEEQQDYYQTGLTELWTAVKEEMAKAELEYHSLVNRNVKVAATRFRDHVNNMKNAGIALRKFAIGYKNTIPKKVKETQPEVLEGVATSPVE